jgi:hypothetical protein
MKSTIKFCSCVAVFWIVSVSTNLLHAQTSVVPNVVLEQCEIDAVQADAFADLRVTAQACALDNAGLRGVIQALEVRQVDYEQVFFDKGRLTADRDRAQRQRWWFLAGGVSAGILITLGVLFAASQ